jgi:hypothetical protein
VKEEAVHVAEVCSELLTYDMYLRENLKSRPEFAKDLSSYKEIRRDFYMKEENERRYLPGYEAYDHKQLAKMTHLEVFRYPVWDMDGKDELTDGKYFVLFDYKERNPLTADARTVNITI